MQPQGWERRQSEEVHTSDERETFLQSNSCKPQTDFICVHFSERFGFLPITVLRTRSGYKPAAYTTTHLSESRCIMALNHYVMVLYTQATHLHCTLKHTKGLFAYIVEYEYVFFSNVLNPDKNAVVGNCKDSRA